MTLTVLKDLSKIVEARRLQEYLAVFSSFYRILVYSLSIVFSFGLLGDMLTD